MKTKFVTNNARPCWSCSGTVAEYTIDMTMSLIEVRCIRCGRSDIFVPNDHTARPATAAEISAAHRSTR
jgi:hypothetical protein